MDVDMDMDMDIDVYHRPNLELACNVGSRLYSTVLYCTILYRPIHRYPFSWRIYVNKYINSYVCLLFINVSFISTITCPIIIHLYNYTYEAFIYISVLLHYNCKNNANIQDVFHRPNLERACNVGCRLYKYIFVYLNKNSIIYIY